MTASHHELDLEALEQLSTGAHSMGTSAVRTCEMITGAVVLATCNRFELYLDLVDGAAAPGSPGTLSERDLAHAADEVARLIAVESGVSQEAARSAFTVRSGEGVTQHLFTVASGLDSMVVGEREIAGQVRRALDASHAESTTSPRLERLFQSASRASKRVAHTTHLGADGRSVVSVGLDLAEASIPPWRQTSAVIVGTGAYAGATVAALRARGCVDIAVYSASGRAEQFATARGVDAVTDLVTALGEADLVVSCSGAGRGNRLARPSAGPGEAAAPGSGLRTDDPSDLRYILETAAVVAARDDAAVRAGDDGTARPLVVLDLALHHDVDPGVGDIDQVLLMDLGTIRSHAPSTSSLPVRAAREIVAAAVTEFTVGETLRAADSVVVGLRDRITAEVEAELARSAGSFTTDADRAAHEKSLRRFAATLLHRGITRIRDAARAGEPLEEFAEDTATVLTMRWNGRRAVPGAGPATPVAEPRHSPRDGLAAG
ncbi:glutamyl-tRNA reductase [Sanguibacter inulinus]|uniref:Glutamyl-tRNA reductase n=2 Tax=Sanguibacter inulinus TaxID=60922 RepID=A0A853EXU1_9MICO|nr:glutamyl-tRNA reductase [Sanguibacter inulinus]NYS95507.1 glutamyl-tRNA reductase [Sanguibacter inulinus]